MKKTLLCLFLSMYAIQISIFVVVILRVRDLRFLIVSCLLTLGAVVLSLINIGMAITNAKNNNTDIHKQKWIGLRILRYKGWAIPFYVFNFFLWLLATSIMIVMPGNVVFLLVVLPIGIGFTYLTLMATSSYSIVLLIALRRNGQISSKQMICHILCQCVFVLDVIDQIILYNQIRQLEKES